MRRRDDGMRVMPGDDARGKPWAVSIVALVTQEGFAHKIQGIVLLGDRLVTVLRAAPDH